MNEAIQEIKQMLAGKAKPTEIMMLDVLATIAQRVQQLEIEVNALREGKSNGQAQKAQGSFNIG
jgi:hypothetical protein